MYVEPRVRRRSTRRWAVFLFALSEDISPSIRFAFAVCISQCARSCACAGDECSPCPRSKNRPREIRQLPDTSERSVSEPGGVPSIPSKTLQRSFSYRLARLPSNRGIPMRQGYAHLLSGCQDKKRGRERAKVAYSARTMLCARQRSPGPLFAISFSCVEFGGLSKERRRTLTVDSPADVASRV